MLFNVQAILFDIDGTLVDSTGAVERSWRSWADKHGIDAEKILAVCHGRRSEDTIADFLPPSERDAAIADLADLELDDLEGVVALPAVRQLLSQLPRDRWAAVTSGSRKLMGARLAAAGLPAPSVMVAAEDVAAGKPDPEGYRKAAVALGHEPSSCLVIEDAPAGLAAGRAAGAAVLAVATSHPAVELTSSADVVVPDLSDCTITPTDTGLEVAIGAQPG